MIDVERTKQNIKSMTELKGLTRGELAQSCYVSEAAVNKWYYTPGVLPNIFHFAYIAEALNVTIQDLIITDHARQ